QPVPGGKERRVVDVGEEGFRAEIIDINMDIKLVARHGIHEMDGEGTAGPDGEVERTQDLHGAGVEILRQVRVRSREGRFGRLPVEDERERPRLTIEDR